MKKATRFLAGFLAFLLFSLSNFSAATTVRPQAADLSSDELYTLRQAISSDLQVLLTHKMGGFNALDADPGFAGFFLNSFGQLVVGVTTENTANLMACIQDLPMNVIVSDNVQNYQAVQRNTVLSTLSIQELTDNCLQFQQMTYSLAYLKSIQNVLGNHLSEFGIHEIGINVKENQLEIHMENTEDHMRLLEWLYGNINNFDESTIKVYIETNEAHFFISNTNGIEESIEKISDTANMYAFTYGYAYPGTRILSPYSSGGTIGPDATLGFCAMDRETKRYGIVVNAHAISNSNEIRASGVTDDNATCYFLGSASKKQLGNTIDAAFVPFSNSNAWGSSYNIQSSAGSAIWRVAADNEYFYSTIVSGYGMVSGKIDGIIIDTLSHKTISGVNFNDLIKVSGSATVGDSGAPIFITNAQGRRCLIGILIGGTSSEFYVAKIENILQEFSLEEYVPYRRGDINMDRIIDETDANLILKLAIDATTVSAEAAILADVNFDGVADTTDARIVLQRVSQ